MVQQYKTLSYIPSVVSITFSVQAQNINLGVVYYEILGKRKCHIYEHLHSMIHEAINCTTQAVLNYNQYGNTCIHIGLIIYISNSRFLMLGILQRWLCYGQILMRIIHLLQ